MRQRCPHCGEAQGVHRKDCLHHAASPLRRPVAPPPPAVTVAEAVTSSPAESGAATCPRCRVAMRTVTIDDDEMDVCAGCGGAWYDSGEFEAHLERMQRRGPPPAAPTAPAPPRETKVVYLPCARCGGQMVRKAFNGDSGVVVDVCADHGVFLDPGELAAILRYLADDKVRAAAKARVDKAWAAAMAAHPRTPPSELGAVLRQRVLLRSLWRGFGWRFWW